MKIKKIILMIEPKTLIATLMPFLLGLTITRALQHQLNILNNIMFLVSALFIQMGTNLVNDYSDLKKDNLSYSSNEIEKEKEFLNKENIKLYKSLIIRFYSIAIIIGLILVFITGYKLMFIGIIGVILSIAYSFGKPPISYTPFGDITAGILMGGLIPMAVVYVNSYQIEFISLVLSIPLIIMVASILTTNNTSDTERDVKSGRKTLSILLGRRDSKKLIIIAPILAYFSILFNLLFFFNKISIFYFLGILIIYFNIKKISKYHFTYEERAFTMLNISKLTFIISSIYIISILEILLRTKQI